MRLAQRRPARGPGALIALAVIAALFGLQGAVDSAAGQGSARDEAGSARAASNSPRTGRVGRGASFPRRSPAPGRPVESLPEVQLGARAGSPGSGEPVVVSVRMVLSGQAARYVALEVGADPAFLRYVGHRPTGRGGLIVRESPSVPGVVTIFRSSLQGGFDSVETIVELEFEPLAPGAAPLALASARVLDGAGRDLGATFVVEDLVLE